MKKIKWGILALAMVMALSIVGCGGSKPSGTGENKEDNEGNETVAEETEAEKVASVIPESELIVNIFGVDYDMNNVTPRDFVNNGFEIMGWSDMQKKADYSHPHSWGYVDLKVNWDYVDQTNYDYKSKNLPESFYDQQVTYISYEDSRVFADNEHTGTFPKGVAFNTATYDSIIAAYGEPDEKESEAIEYYNFAGDWSMRVQFDDEKLDRLYSISLTYNGETKPNLPSAKEDDNEASFADDGNTYANMSVDELFSFAIGKIAGDSSVYKFEEPQFIQIEVPYARINNSEQSHAAYHLGTEKIETSMENVEYLYVDPIIMTEKQGVKNPAIISQEKFDEIKAMIKDANDQSTLMLRGTIYDIKRSNFGVNTGKFVYTARIVVSDVIIKK